MEIEGDLILDSPATPENIRLLARQGVLDRQSLERALKIIGFTPDAGKWTRFLDRFLLIFGAAFLVAGVFFFFAYNWVDMHRFVKLGLLQGLVLAAAGLAHWRGLDNLSGKIALSAAALMTGGLLAVYGQVYQTGADSYSLFMWWAILITGWVLISKFTPLWFIWVILWNLALGVYWAQLVGGEISPIVLLLTGLNLTALFSWETFRARGIAWLESRWTPRILLLLVSIMLTSAAIEFVTKYNNDYSRLEIITFVVYLVLAATVFYFYSQKLPDTFMLTVTAFSLMVTFNIWIGDSISDMIGVFVVGALFIAEAAAFVWYIRRLPHQEEEVPA